MISQSLTKQQQYVLEQFNGQCYNPNSDVQEGRLWDSITFSKGATISGGNANFFTNQAGKTYADTNVTQPKRLDDPEAFCIRRIIFSFSKDSPDEEIYSLAERGVWSLWLGQKYMVRSMLIHMQTHNCSAPFRTCEFCKSIYVNDRTCPSCGASQFTISGADGELAGLGRQFYMDLSINVIIDNQQSFYVSFDCTPHHTFMAGGVKFWCHLEGLHARGVQ